MTFYEQRNLHDEPGKKMLKTWFAHQMPMPLV